MDKGKLLKILDIDDITIHFQPIVCIKAKRIVGFEALARGIRNGDLIPPKILFELAEENSIKTELDHLCQKLAFQTFKKLYEKNDNFILFLNFDAYVIDLGIRTTSFILRLAKENNVPPQNVVIEITETEVKNLESLKRFVETCKKLGFLIALDDVGIKYSNLNRISELKPHILKIDQVLVREVQKDRHKSMVVSALVFLARGIGALTLAEGVETHEEILETMQIGIDFHQGFYFSKPKPINFLDLKDMWEDLQRKKECLQNTFHEYMITHLRQKKAKYQRYKEILEKILDRLIKLRSEKFEECLRNFILINGDIECIYVVDIHGIMVTRTIFSAKVKVYSSPIFRPASIGEDLSCREYIYSLIGTNLTFYATEPYISLATGNLVITMSHLFESVNGEKFILCVDFIAAH